MFLQIILFFKWYGIHWSNEINVIYVIQIRWMVALKCKNLEEIGRKYENRLFPIDDSACTTYINTK